VEEWDSGGASARSGGIKVRNPPQDLDAPMAKRSAKHPMSGKKDSFEIASNEGASGRVFQEV
jgi:hypothetical protein